jgi:hypothetical protein
MGVWTSEPITDFIENRVTARTGGTLALLRSRVRVSLSETLKGFPIRFPCFHDGDVVFAFNVFVELFFGFGEILDILGLQAVKGYAVFTGEGHLITGKRL